MITPLKLREAVLRARAGGRSYEQIAELLVVRGFVVRSEESRELRYHVGAPGLRFAAARGGPKLRRTTADAIIAKLIARCRAANVERKFAHWVARLSVFGSYLGDAAVLGDLDVVVDLEPKLRDRDEQMALARARWHAARAAGRRRET